MPGAPGSFLFLVAGKAAGENLGGTSDRTHANTPLLGIDFKGGWIPRNPIHSLHSPIHSPLHRRTGGFFRLRPDHEAACP